MAASSFRHRASVQGFSDVIYTCCIQRLSLQNTMHLPRASVTPSIHVDGSSMDMVPPRQGYSDPPVSEPAHSQRSNVFTSCSMDYVLFFNFLLNKLPTSLPSLHCGSLQPLLIIVHPSSWALSAFVVFYYLQLKHAVTAQGPAVEWQQSPTWYLIWWLKLFLLRDSYLAAMQCCWMIFWLHFLSKYMTAGRGMWAL